MDNYLLLPPCLELEQLSVRLGFTKTLFLNRDFIMISGTPKELLTQAQRAKQKGLQIIYFADEEKKLRFVLEKVPVNIIFGVEKLFAKDSLHYPKGGLDQVLCKIAAGKEKAVGFSFSELLNAVNLPQLLLRMKFNLKLCRKYGVKTVFSNFSRKKEEMRSAKDLEAVFRVFGQKRLSSAG